jgi:hypothetical protein
MGRGDKPEVIGGCENVLWHYPFIVSFGKSYIDI